MLQVLAAVFSSGPVPHRPNPPTKTVHLSLFGCYQYGLEAAVLGATAARPGGAQCLSPVCVELLV